jgi:hypothetical protein
LFSTVEETAIPTVMRALFGANRFNQLGHSKCRSNV